METHPSPPASPKGKKTHKAKKKSSRDKKDSQKEGAAVEASSTKAPGDIDAEPRTEHHEHQQVQAQAWFLFQQGAPPDEANENPLSESSNKEDLNASQEPPMMGVPASGSVQKVRDVNP